MNAQLDLPDREFLKASQNWHLDRMLTGIADKGEFLTPREQKMLRGLICGYTPKEIAEIGFNKSDSKSISPELSKIYQYVELLLETPLQVNSGNICRLLEDADYRL